MNCLFGGNSCTWVLVLVIVFLLSQNGGSCGCAGTANNGCGCNGGCNGGCSCGNDFGSCGCGC